MDKRVFVMLFLVLSVFVLAGCANKTPEPISFTIDMTEYAFAPENLEVKVGQQVTINLINKGQLPHEIMFGRDVIMVNNRPSGYEHDMFEEAGVEPMVMGMEDDVHMDQAEEHAEGDSSEGTEHGHEGFMVLLKETGDQGTITFMATKDMVGEWEMGCFELDGVHYDAGMIGTFTVTE